MVEALKRFFFLLSFSPLQSNNLKNILFLLAFFIHFSFVLLFFKLNKRKDIVISCLFSLHLTKHVIIEREKEEE